MKPDRRSVVTGMLMSVIVAPHALAVSKMPFDIAAFEAAQNSGKTILLEITAKWCGPCQRQKPIVSRLLENPGYNNLTMFDADYDANKDELRRINALQLTTLIVYHGRTEILRSSGETRPEMLEAILRKAI